MQLNILSYSKEIAELCQVFFSLIFSPFLAIYFSFPVMVQFFMSVNRLPPHAGEYDIYPVHHDPHAGKQPPLLSS